MSEAKQSLERVVFEIKMKFSIEKSDEAFKNKNQEIVICGFFCFSFWDNLETFDVVDFLTPHDSRNLTTVKFLESALPKSGRAITPKSFRVFS